jgi:UDP-N-acetyl-D-mannosaminouronate:lipid I N-acetyl-D-mannosaminouronosyltransferase
MIDKVFINGKAIYPFKSTAEVLNHIDNKIGILIAINTEKILSNDKTLTDIIENNIGYPDGIGAVFALRRKGINSSKIPGAYLWLNIIKRYYKEKSFFFIGSTSAVINATIEKLRLDFPGIKIVGYRDGYFGTNEISSIVREIKETRPEIVYVAMGSPKQEYIMDQFVRSYPALYMGLGGSFDLYCEKVKPVPIWWNKVFKWEGLYRSMLDIGNFKRWKRQIPALRIIPKLIFNKL